MADILTLERVEAIRERAEAATYLGGEAQEVADDVFDLLADRDALTAEVVRQRLVEHDHETLQAAYASLGEMHKLAHARAEAAERKVAAAREVAQRYAGVFRGDPAMVADALFDALDGPAR